MQPIQKDNNNFASWIDKVTLPAFEMRAIAEDRIYFSFGSSA